VAGEAVLLISAAYLATIDERKWGAWVKRAEL